MKNNLLKFPLALYVSVAILICTFLFVSYFGLEKKAQASVQSRPLSGYAWSSNIGWISFSGAGYQVTLDQTGDPTVADLNGYAWANPRDTVSNTNNIGWISFNGGDVSGCPGGQAQVRLDTGKVSGFARVLAHDSSWDGCISLSGTNFTSPNLSGNGGVTFATTSNSFKGYAWDSGVLGWISFSGSSYGVTVPPNPCGIGDFTLTGYSACINGQQSEVWTKNAHDQCTGNWMPPPSIKSCGNGPATTTPNPGDAPGTGPGVPVGQRDGVIPDYTLSINPALIAPGGVCNVTWSVAQNGDLASLCTLSGPGISADYSGFNPADKGFGGTFNFTTNTSATYKFVCSLNGLASSTISKTCSVAPTFKEF